MKYPTADYAKYLISLRKLSPAEQKTSLKKFVDMLIKNGDIKDWQRIEDVYESLVEKITGKKRAVVTYAGPVQKPEIERALSGYDIQFVEDKSILGGVSIRIGDTRIDNTVSGRLNEVNKALSK
jgi:F0F1-type ATP synthase delta subunit